MSSDEDIEAGKMLDLFLANSSEPGFSNYKPHKKDTMQHQSITEKIQERKAHFVSWTFLPETDTIRVSCRNPFAEVGEVIREREIQCTVAQLKLWAEGENIQVAMPQASPEDREFLISGCTPEDWDAMFSSLEEDE